MLETIIGIVIGLFIYDLFLKKPLLNLLNSIYFKKDKGMKEVPRDNLKKPINLPKRK